MNEQTDQGVVMEKILVECPSFGGKTTLHREGIATDPEELPIYRKWKEGWGDEKRAGNPKWREEQQQAYGQALADLFAEGASPLVAHPLIDDYRKMATEAGYRLIPYVPDDYWERVISGVKDMESSPFDTQVSRLTGAIGGLNVLLTAYPPDQLVRSETELKALLRPVSLPERPVTAQDMSTEQ